MKHLQQLNGKEIPLCLSLNKINHLRPVSWFFSVVSRLGDGVFWYVLMLMLLVFYGVGAVWVVLHMLTAGFFCLLVYKLLKSSTGRIRPYRYHADIFQNVAALDKFSFPSGHTLHAVNFTWIVLFYYPEWVLLVVPFTFLVALSRVILGLHYPSDVLVGAVLGGSIAELSLYLVA